MVISGGVLTDEAKSKISCGDKSTKTFDLDINIYFKFKY